MRECLKCWNKMLYQKDGLPEEGEIVLCNVTSVQHHSVFVRLEEYGKTGMIHISEISPGRIRNIRDYVVEDKVIICKVLRINHERGHIDLSLRRVSDGQRREKANEIKQEQKAEKIIEFVAKQLKTNKDDIFEKIQEQIFANYPNVYSCFENCIKDEKTLENINIPSEIAKPLLDLIKQRIKPPEVELHAKMRISSYEAAGVETIKELLKKIQKLGNKDIAMGYLGGGTYSFSIKAEEYKSAEKKIKKIVGDAEDFCKKNSCEFAFERTEK